MVTIIILIILATVSINVVFGEGGLIKRAEQSSDVAKESKAKEKLTMKLEEYVIDVQMENIRETDAKDAYLCTKLSELGPTSVATDPKYYEVEVDGWLFWVNRETLEIISQGKAEPVYPEKIEVTNKNIEVYIGEGKVVDLKLTPNNASKRFIKYTSANEEIATVNNGVVTGIKEGTTEITIESTEDESIKDTCTVTVKAIELTGISLNKTETKVGVGKTETLTVTYTPSNATYKDIKWTSADRTIATVDENTGLITGIKAGETTITATSMKYPNITAECRVSVELVLVIENGADLYKFAQDVNSGNKYEGYTVKLANDITINEGVTYTFDDDTGLIEVKQNENRFYIGTGYNGDTSGTNTTFDSTASAIGAYYIANNSTETMTPIEGTMKLSDEVSCKTITCNGITLKIWEPIGYDNIYYGNFNGQNHIITGIYSVYETRTGNGLFHSIYGESMEKLTIKNSVFCANAGTTFVYNMRNSKSTEMKLKNLNSDNNIVVGSAGIVSYVYGISSNKDNYIISKCSNNSIIISRYNAGVGGIATFYRYGIIEECYNTGKIKADSSDYVGGIRSYSPNETTDVTIKYCYNTGEIYGRNNVGGINASYRDSVNILNCYNTGNIVSTKCSTECYIGGISTKSSWSTNTQYKIKDCYNKGDITAKCIVGGIVGQGNNLERCYNEGKINSTYSKPYKIGGIIGYAYKYPSVSLCKYIYYTDGNITTGIGKENPTDVDGSNTGCTRYSTENWPYNILGVVGNDKFTTTEGRNENMPILKWEIGQ